MSIQIKNDHINGTDPFNILDFNITSTGIEGIFIDSNCSPVKVDTCTFVIQDCTIIDCTTINCNKAQCTTINCTTIDCTTIQCNQVKCNNVRCSYDRQCDCSDSE